MLSLLCTLTVVSTALTGCGPVADLVGKSQLGYNYGLGLSLVEQRRFQAAISTLSEGIDRYPSAGLLTLRGFCYCKIGNYGKALQDFDSALAQKAISGDIATANKHLSPIPYYEESFIYANRALAAFYLERVEPARLDADEAVRLRPDQDIWYLYRAALRLKLSEPGDALADVDTAIKLNSKNAIAYHLRSKALEALGETEQAKIARKRAEELKYDNVFDYTQYDVE